MSISFEGRVAIVTGSVADPAQIESIADTKARQLDRILQAKLILDTLERG